MDRWMDTGLQRWESMHPLLWLKNGNCGFPTKLFNLNKLILVYGLRWTHHNKFSTSESQLHSYTFWPLFLHSALWYLAELSSIKFLIVRGTQIPPRVMLPVLKPWTLLQGNSAKHSSLILIESIPYQYRVYKWALLNFKTSKSTK